MTTLLITGSRSATPVMLDFARRAVVRAYFNGWKIVVGDASGIDHQVIMSSCKMDIPLLIYGITPAPRHICCNKHRWASYGQVNGDYLARDRYMVKNADCVLAIWNGRSRGTKYTYDYAIEQGKTAWIRTFQP